MSLKSYHTRGTIEAGCDEAGRGCLAGPVVAAAVILPTKWRNKILDDSKKLTEKQRNKLRLLIERNALDYAVCFIDHQEIDRINILQASFKAMHGAIDQLKLRPERLLIDGNRFQPYQDIPHDCIIKGDGIYMSIAAASILAKTYRDEYMLKMSEKFPNYSWNTNKGYGTAMHRKAIIEHGITDIHRKSFRLYPLPEQGDLFEQN